MESDAVFIEDNNNVEKSVNTSTTPLSAKAPAKKRTTKRQKLDDGCPGPGVSSRGPNWNEGDSIRLVKAY
jgi:hypothetical protein